jgi:hypothetical protein
MTALAAPSTGLPHPPQPAATKSSIEINRKL